MKQPCGCCAGIEIVTPEPEANRPGLTAIAYRVGTHATFLESMLARLTTLYLDVPAANGSGPSEQIYALRRLTTREPSDPSIALLDAWATVADVLTFYQERIANEGYLPTATERRSILELARLVGYKLRPGVSASVYLAFTVADGFSGEIPAGTRAQSIPGTGELPQFFETSEALAARDAWNNLKPRVTRPQMITLASDAKGNPLDSGTDARTRDTLYFQGFSTNLKAGDALLIVLGDGPGQQVPRLIDSVDVQADQNRTEVTLQEAGPMLAGTILETVTNAVQPFIGEASSIFAGSDLASRVADILQNLLADVAPVANPQTAADLVRGTVPQVQGLHDIAAKRHFTRLEPWIARVLGVLNSLAEELPGSKAGDPGPGPAPPPGPPQQAAPPSPLGNLMAILAPLSLPPSLQPASSVRLARTVAQAFSPQADTAPRVLAAFRPAAATTLYRAWAGVETPASQVRVCPARVEAGLFANNSMGLPQYDTNNKLTGYAQPSIRKAWGSLVQKGSHEEDIAPSAVALDGTYDKIRTGSWVAIDRPELSVNGSATGRRTVTFHHATGLVTVSMATPSGYAGKSTQLTLNPAWLSDLMDPRLTRAIDSTDLLRGTVVYAQTEPLDLAEEPLDTDVEGDAIELADLYDGLESGRWIIVSGERTDIPNVTGVTASELVMVSGVTQGTRAPLCATFPAGFIPFSKVYYTTAANALGDRLVVGELAPGAWQAIRKLPSPEASNQQYCEQVQLAPGLYVNAYVPTTQERAGSFGSFQGLLVNPSTGVPYPSGAIPTSVLGRIFAWRISSEKVHTVLTLANKLAYKYDTSTVTIYGNVVKATHGQTVGEVLGNGDGRQSLQKFTVHQAPLTYVPALTPAGAQSSLVVRVNDVEWHEEDSIADLGPMDRSYVTQTDDADRTSVIFGSGERGARLPTGSANVKAVYRYGIGKPGNVKAQQISQLATRPLGAKDVINPLPATGGADRDGRDQARRNAPLAVMALDRLVSTEDYADFARTYAGIGKATAARLFDGRRQVVQVTIAGADDIPIDLNSDLYRNLVQALHQFGDPNQPIHVTLRRLKLLVMSAGVRVKPDYQWESVEPKIRAALLDALGFDRRDLGQSAFASGIISIIQAVQGVAYVDLRIFDAVSEGITVDELAGLAGTLAPNPYVEAELARVDLAASDPSKRILPAELVFLTPDIPDTLILTEIR